MLETEKDKDLLFFLFSVYQISTHLSESHNYLLKTPVPKCRHTKEELQFKIFGEQPDRTVGRVVTLHMADLGSISGNPCSHPSTPRDDPFIQTQEIPKHTLRTNVWGKNFLKRKKKKSKFFWEGWSES